MNHITLNREEADFVTSIAVNFPGVAKHRIAKALFRLGRRVINIEPRHLEAELADIVAELEQRRK